MCEVLFFGNEYRKTSGNRSMLSELTQNKPLLIANETLANWSNPRKITRAMKLESVDWPRSFGLAPILMSQLSFGVM